MVVDPVGQRRWQTHAMGDDGEILDIKTADLTATAPAFHTESVALGRALHNLKLALADAGSAWGDDDQGTDFHKAYGPRVRQIEDSTKILTEGLASIHLAMSDMADGHIENEKLVRAMFSTIRVDPHGGKGDDQ
ncbi:hypothetical protein ABZ401_04555 [Streptomyces sp. NPDC005892]|uniref:hypothetical protein n=1 Tax=Streptomyces sp. NPDC005892 TaxID=3155593 RepID=UPI0033E1602D